MSEEQKEKTRQTCLKRKRFNKTKLYKRIRSLKEYETWRTAVFVRDKYTCQDCGQVGYDLQAHHKESTALIISKNNIKSIKEALACKKLFDINNGLTLCVKCHQKTNNY